MADMTLAQLLKQMPSDMDGYEPRQTGAPVPWGQNNMVDYMKYRQAAHALGALGSGAGGALFGGIAATDPEPVSKTAAALAAAGLLSNAGIQAQKQGMTKQGEKMWAAAPYPQYKGK